MLESIRSESYNVVDAKLEENYLNFIHHCKISSIKKKPQADHN